VPSKGREESGRCNTGQVIPPRINGWNYTHPDIIFTETELRSTHVKIRLEQLNPHSCHTYLIGLEGSRTVMLVDPVLEHYKEYLALIREHDLHLTHVIDTHTHADHISGAAALKDLTGCEYVMHSNAPAHDYRNRTPSNLRQQRTNPYFRPRSKEEFMRFIEDLRQKLIEENIPVLLDVRERDSIRAQSSPCIQRRRI
jgi:glyoxylase-like metal-dependent hydrolase (beta-lactamase superfamily II)